MTPTAVAPELKLTLSKQINASPQRVFQAWLDPQLLCKWIGPRAWVESCEAIALEPRVGGRYELRTQTRPMPGRDDCTGGVTGVYRAIDRHTRLSFTWRRSGEDSDSLVTVLFEPNSSGTLLTLTHEGFTSEQARDQHAEGWRGSLTQLGDLVELRLTLQQQVNAPPHKVFDALLDPKLVCQWMGPRTMVNSCEVMAMEPRVGGRYRLKLDRRADSPNGPGTMFVTGVYREITRPSRLIYSWLWEDQGHESQVTYDLSPHAGGTQVTITHDGFASVESKLGHQRGWTVSMQQLAKLFGAA